MRSLLLNLVELSGYCPPSPKSLTGAFSRLGFEFYFFDGRLKAGLIVDCRSFISYERRITRTYQPEFGRIAERLGPTLCVRSLL